MNERLALVFELLAHDWCAITVYRHLNGARGKWRRATMVLSDRPALALPPSLVGVDLRDYLAVCAEESRSRTDAASMYQVRGLL